MSKVQAFLKKYVYEIFLQLLPEYIENADRFIKSKEGDYISIITFTEYYKGINKEKKMPISISNDIIHILELIILEFIDLISKSKSLKKYTFYSLGCRNAEYNIINILLPLEQQEMYSTQEILLEHQKHTLVEIIKNGAGDDKEDEMYYDAAKLFAKFIIFICNCIIMNLILIKDIYKFTLNDFNKSIMNISTIDRYEPLRLLIIDNELNPSKYILSINAVLGKKNNSISKKMAAGKVKNTASIDEASVDAVDEVSIDASIDASVDTAIKSVDASIDAIIKAVDSGEDSINKIMIFTHTFSSFLIDDDGKKLKNTKKILKIIRDWYDKYISEYISNNYTDHSVILNSIIVDENNIKMEIGYLPKHDLNILLDQFIYNSDQEGINKININDKLYIVDSIKEK